MKKGDKLNLLLMLVMLAGIVLVLYPTVSNQWNAMHQSRAIASYVEAVAEIDNDRYEKLWAEADAYNQALYGKQNRYYMTEAERAEYESLLDVTGSGIMGYVEIPEIQVSLPIYHGTSDAVLQVAAGHIEGTSLPVGGAGTHSALSGHRGLPSAKLFTSLDRLEEGDLFLLRVLDETLTYEVDRILIVEPEDMEALELEPDKDLCTLVTCTPYGVNTHRLLVRGHRVDNLEEVSTVRVTADAVQIEPVLVAPAVAAPILLVLLVWLMASTSGRKKKRYSSKKKAER